MAIDYGKLGKTLGEGIGTVAKKGISQTILDTVQDKKVQKTVKEVATVARKNWKKSDELEKQKKAKENAENATFEKWYMNKYPDTKRVKVSDGYVYENGNGIFSIEGIKNEYNYAKSKNFVTNVDKQVSLDNSKKLVDESKKAGLPLPQIIKQKQEQKKNVPSISPKNYKKLIPLWQHDLQETPKQALRFGAGVVDTGANVIDYADTGIKLVKKNTPKILKDVLKLPVLPSKYLNDATNSFKPTADYLHYAAQTSRDLAKTDSEIASKIGDVTELGGGLAATVASGGAGQVGKAGQFASWALPSAGAYLNQGKQMGLSDEEAFARATALGAPMGALGIINMNNISKALNLNPQSITNSLATGYGIGAGTNALEQTYDNTAGYRDNFDLGEVNKSGVDMAGVNALLHGVGATAKGVQKVANNPEVQQLMKNYKTSQKGSIVPNRLFRLSAPKDTTGKMSEKEIEVLKQRIRKEIEKNQIKKEEIKSDKIANVLDKVEKPKIPLMQKAKDGWNKTYQEVVDTGHTVKKIANAVGNQKVYNIYDNAKKAVATVENALETYLPSKTGVKIGKSYKEIITQVPENQKVDLHEYMLHKLNIERHANGKPVFGKSVTPEVSKTKIAEYEKSNPEFKQVSEEMRTYVDKVVNEYGKDYINKAQKEKFYKDYLPILREERPLNSNVTGNNKNITTGKMVGNAKGGNQNIMPLDQTVGSFVNRWVSASKKNDIYKEILKQVRENPEKMQPYAELVKQEPKMQNLEKKSESLEDVVERVENVLRDDSKGKFLTVYEHGKPVELRISDMLYDSLKGGRSHFDGNPVVENVFKKPSNFVKGTITSYNPLFSLTNFAKDFQDSLVFSKNNAKIVAKYPEAVKKMATNSKEWQEYKAMGGKQSGFFNTKEGYEMNRDTKNPLVKGGKTVLDGLNLANQSVEQLPRFAEYLSSVKKYGNSYDGKMQAMMDAAEITLNFNRGGKFTRSIDDLGTMYLNASVQGLDKVVRELAAKDKSRVLKVLGTAVAVGMTPSLLNEYLLKDDKDYQQIDNRTKDMYYLIKKEDGTFVKIPKGRTWGGVFGSAGQRTTRALNGDDKAFEDYATTVATNLAPANPLENNMYGPGINAVFSKDSELKDFAGRNVIPTELQNLSGKYQFDEGTSSIAKGIGQATGMSPKRLDYLMKSYTGGVAQTALPLFTPQAENLNPLTSKFIADPVYVNKSDNDFYNLLDQKTKQANDFKAENKLPSEYSTVENLEANYLKKIQKEVAKLQDEKEKIQGSNWSDKDKQEEVRKLQEQINQKYKEATDKVNSGKATFDIWLINKPDKTPTEQESVRLYQATGNTDHFPKGLEKPVVTIDKQEVEITPTQYKNFNKRYNKLFDQYYSQMINTDEYKQLNDGEKSKYIREKLSNPLRNALRDELKQFLINKYGTKK